MAASERSLAEKRLLENLQSDLRQLSNEAKKKHPPLREVSPLLGARNSGERDDAGKDRSFAGTVRLPTPPRIIEACKHPSLTPWKVIAAKCRQLGNSTRAQCQASFDAFIGHKDQPSDGDVFPWSYCNGVKVLVHWLRVF